MPKQVVLSEQAQDDLDALIEYVFDKELIDYANCDDDERASHIFEAICRLNQVISFDGKSAKEYMDRRAVL